MGIEWSAAALQLRPYPRRTAISPPLPDTRFPEYHLQGAAAPAAPTVAPMFRSSVYASSEASSKSFFPKFLAADRTPVLSARYHCTPV